MKRLALILLAACSGGTEHKVKRDNDAAAAVVRGGGKTAGGATLETADEHEPNDSDATASPLPPGHVVHAVLASDADVDVYKVTVDHPGQLKVTLGGVAGVDLVLELRDQSGSVVAKSDHGGAASGEGFPNFGVEKGDYFVAVKEFVKKAPKPPKKKGKAPPPDAGVAPSAPSPPYELKVEEIDQPAALTEIEPDDDAGQAIEVLLADAVHGWLGWNGDVDLWKLALEGVGPGYCIDIDVSAVDGVALTVAVMNAGGDKLLTRKGAKGGPVQIRSLVPSLAADAPPWHLVSITGDHANPDIPYELRFTARAREDDEEAEPNDDDAHATPLVGAGATGPSGVVRATYTAGDVDRFAVPPQPQASLLDVGLEPPPGVDLDLTVGASGQPPIAEAHTVGPGAKERLTGVQIPANTAVIVTAAPHGKLAKDDGGDARPYRLTWSVTAVTTDPMPPEEQ